MKKLQYIWHYILQKFENDLLMTFIPKDQVVTEDKNNIVYEIDCSKYKAIYFGESKWSLKRCSDELKRSVRNCNCKENETAKHCLEEDHNFSWNLSGIKRKLLIWKAG